MPTTIESLELEVQSSATSATGGIDALSASLSKLKNAVKGGVGLTSVANQIRNLNTALQGIDGSSAGKLDTLSNSLSKLSGLGNIKISPSIANQIRNLGTAATSLNGVDFSGISRLASSLQPLTTLGKSNLTSFITQLGKLPQLAQTLNTMNIPQFASQLNQLSSALAPLASQLNTVSTAFSRLPTNIKRTVTATNAMATANNTAAKSYVNLWAKLRMAKTAVLSVARVIASWLTESNKYIEDMNLFTASMGEYAESASKYAEQVGELMGIDPGEWMRNQGTFMTLIKGFGVAGEKANMMSRNLTQLAYDLASFENKPFEEAMQKVQSGIAGELEPLRRWGYDLSIARLQQEALRLGIDKSVSSMTQAEKAQLRYYAAMTQVTWAHGDMARTLEAPANQLRILRAQLQQCSRAMGNLFLPILQKVLPYLIAFAKFLREIIVLFASMFNISLPEFDYSSIIGAGGAMSDLSDAESEATKGAKKLKNALLGIDELNVLSKDSTSGSGSGDTVGGGDLGIELPDNDKWLEGITSKADAIREKLQPVLDWIKKNLDEILAGVVTIGAAFLAWKIAKGIANFIEKLSKLSGLKLTGFIDPAFLASLGVAASSFGAFYNAVREIQEEGATFSNVLQIIGTFTSGVGGFLTMLGCTKVGGALITIGGVVQIIAQIKEISEEGANFDNVTDLIVGIGTVMTGLLFFTGHGKWAGITVGITSAVQIIQFFHDNWESIKNQQWGEIDWSQLILPAIGFVVGVGSIISTLKRLGTVTKNMSDTKTTIDTATKSTGEIGDTIGGGKAGGGLTSKLTSLAKNLALGIAIIAEVAAAAVLIVGAIWVLGLELEQVGIAWQPVIANGQTVAIAMGIGTGILVAVGVVTALLGTLGGAVCGQIAIGIAILAELGVAAGLFIIEIWAIGKGLDEIGKAWKPVIANGKTIATGIGLGTALLIGIGVVTAALGVATVASAGLLPLAIALGTALLVELAAAFIIFTESLVAVADELSNNLSPSLTKLNGKLPTLSTNMRNFVDFMTEFAGQVVRYTEVSAIAGLAATIDTIIGWFTEDPIDKLADDVNDIYSQTKTLNEKLNLAVPELKSARDLLKKYQGFLAEIETLTNSNVNLNNGQFANMKEVGAKIVTGFVDGIKSKSTEFSNTATTIVNGFKNQLVTSSATSKTSFTTWATNLKNWFTQSGYGAINSTTFEGYAKNVVTGFRNGITSNYPTSKNGVTTWADYIKKWFSNVSYGNVSETQWKAYAKNVVTGFETGVTSNYPTSKNGVTTWADYIKKWFSNVSYGNVSETQWKAYAKNVVTGFSSGITSNYSTAKSSMTTFANSVKSWFEKPDGSNTLSSQFYNIGKNIIQGFIDGVNSLWDSAMKRIKEFGKEVIKKGKEGTEEHSPSKAFRQIGAFVIEGFNIGIKDMMGSSFSLMDTWTGGITAYSPTVALSVDASALKYYDSASYARTISANVSANSNNQLFVDESAMKEVMKEAVLQALNESSLSADMRRQADKEEQTIVQVGNRTVTDAVTTQKKANGYVFAT